MNPLHYFERMYSIKMRFLVSEWPSVLRQDPCVYCYDTAPTLDHIVPLARNGSNYWTNLAPSCSRCNQAKGHTGLLMFLIGERDTSSVPRTERMMREEKMVPMLTYRISDLYGES